MFNIKKRYTQRILNVKYTKQVDWIMCSLHVRRNIDLPLKLEVLPWCILTYVSMKYVMKAGCVAIATEIVAGVCRHVYKGNGPDYAKETVCCLRFLNMKKIGI